MVDSVLKIIQGWVKIKGGTDGTFIGNSSDSLKTTVTSSALPSGASTLTAQNTGNSSLNSIDTKTPSLIGGRVPVDGSGVTQPISASSLPLPTGAATQATLLELLNTFFSTTGAPAGNALGLVVRPVTLELPTFSVANFDVTIANNKSMLAVQNTGISVVRIREIWIINDRTTAVTGVAGEFQVNRITSFTGGTSVPIVNYDTIDTLPAGISASSGATVSGEGDILRRGRWSTDEWGPGTLDTESLDHATQNTEPFWRQTPNGKALTIRQNQGVHIKFATNSTAGAFTLRIIFTTE